MWFKETLHACHCGQLEYAGPAIALCYTDQAAHLGFVGGGTYEQDIFLKRDIDQAILRLFSSADPDPPPPPTPPPLRPPPPPPPPRPPPPSTDQPPSPIHPPTPSLRPTHARTHV